MADNVNITAGSGVVIRSDEVSGSQIQVIKIALGLDGAEDLLLDSGSQTSANSLPVVIASDQSSILVVPYANSASFVSGVTTALINTTSTSLVSAPGAGLRNYITHVIATNSGSVTGTFVNLRDGNAGTVIYAAYAAKDGGGFSISFPVPLRQPSSASPLHVSCTTTGGSVIVSASGYKGV